MRKSRLFRMGCFLFGGLFFAISQVWAVNNDAVKISSNAQPSSIEQLLKMKIPSGWGIIKDSYNSGTNKLVINIQDAHCDFEAQKNIANILNSLATNFNLKVIALEGASGKVENPILSNFPNKKVREDVSLYLVQQGKLTGAEYLAVNSDYDLKLYGVENLRLYMDNLAVFQQAQPFKAEARQYFSILKSSLDVLKYSIYNDNLKKLDILENDYASRKIYFDKYAIELYKLVEESGLRKVNYPTFYELQNVIKLALKVDFQKADDERMQLITALTQIIDDKETISQLVIKSLDFKKGVFSAGEFADFLKDLAFNKKLNMGAYPNFDAYAVYITKYEEVANEKLFLEIKDITKNIKKVFYTDDDQKQLDVLYENLDILTRLVDLKMLNEDISYFFKNKDKINSESFISFIEPQAYKHKVIISLPQEITSIDAYIPVWAKFYEVANTRDSAFIEKTLLHMDNENTDYAALITGGFHTKQLTRLLKEKKISYIVISPKASANENNLYFNIMQGGKSALETFVSQMQSTVAVYIPTEQGLAELTDAEQARSKEKLKEKNDNQIFLLAVGESKSIVAGVSGESMSDAQMRGPVSAGFQVVADRGIKEVEMSSIESLVGKIIKQDGSNPSVIVKSANGDQVILNPKLALVEEGSIQVISAGTVLASAQNEKSSETTTALATAELKVDRIVTNASSKDVLKEVLNTSRAKDLTPIKAAIIIEKVVIALAETGIVDVEAVSGEIQDQSELFAGDTKKLAATVEDIVATTVFVTLQSSPLTDKVVDIVVGEKGLAIPADKQGEAKEIVKANITDTTKITLQLNDLPGVTVNEEQVTTALNVGLAETSKTSKNSGNIIAEVVVSKLEIKDDKQKKLATEIVMGLPTSSVEDITAKLQKGLSVSNTEAAEALNKGLLQANTAINPIMSGVTTISDLVTKEQENLMASQIKPLDISMIQYKAEVMQSDTGKVGRLVFEGNNADPKIINIAANAGVKKDKISSVVIASGDYSKAESVSVEIKPSAMNKGNVTIVISPKKTDMQISKITTRVDAITSSMRKQNNVLDNKGEASALSMIAYQAKRVNEDLAEIQTTKEDNENAPKIKEQNVIFLETDSVGVVDFNKEEDRGFPVDIKGVASKEVWEKITDNNVVVMMNPKGLNSIEFARSVGLPEDHKVIFISPSDIREMHGEESTVDIKVDLRSSYQVMEKRGTNMTRVCVITEKDSANNNIAKEMINNSEVDATLVVTTYPKAAKGQVLDLNMCFTRAVTALIFGKSGNVTQAEKDDIKFLIKSYIGDKQLKITISDDEIDGLFSQEMDSTSMFIVTDIPKAFMDASAALDDA